MIRIEGDPKGVAAAKTMLLELAAKMVRFARVCGARACVRACVRVGIRGNCHVTNLPHEGVK